MDGYCGAFRLTYAITAQTDPGQDSNPSGVGDKGFFGSHARPMERPDNQNPARAAGQSFSKVSTFKRTDKEPQAIRPARQTPTLNFLRRSATIHMPNPTNRTQSMTTPRSVKAGTSVKESGAKYHS